MVGDVSSRLEKSSYWWRRNTMDFVHYNQGKSAGTGGRERRDNPEQWRRNPLCCSGGCLETFCCSTDLTLSILLHSLPLHRALLPERGGERAECLCHEFCKGRYSCNGPAPGNTLSCPVSQAPCTCSALASMVWSSSWWSACLLQCLFLNSWRSWRISSQMRKGQRWPMPWKVSQHPSPKNAVSFGLRALQPSCPALFPGLPFYYKDNDIKHADTKHVDSFSTKPGPLLITSGWFSSWWEGLCTQICLPSGQIHWVCIPRTSLEAVSVAWVS